jgi:hypothetical protein
MFGRRVDRPEGAPDEFGKDVRALWPVVKPGYANVYRGTKNGMYSDLVSADISAFDEQRLGWYQQNGFIVWVG